MPLHAEHDNALDALRTTVSCSEQALTILQKRKAQNRAAQRAFRERKEKHLKDLETQVTELAKAREADQHENGLLKAQVDRLQVELRDYRKRLSLNGAATRSPPLAASNGPQRASTGAAYGQNSFQFDFPKFGAVTDAPTGGIMSSFSSNDNSQRNSVTPPVNSRSGSAHNSFSNNAQQPVLSRANSAGRSLSPNTMFQNGSQNGSPSSQGPLSLDSNSAINFAPYSTNENMHGFASTLPQMNASSSNNNDAFGDLFSPNLLKTLNQNGNGYFDASQQGPTAPSVSTVPSGGDSTAGIPDNRVFRFNSTSNGSDSASPSASSLSQWNMNGTANSSCGTSPEPSHGSPANKEKGVDSFDKTITQNNFDNSNDNAFMSNQYSNNDLSAFAVNNNGLNNDNSFQMPQLDSFDPVLFGDYRDTSSNMLGGNDFSGGFFNDNFNYSAPTDYASPSNLFGILGNSPSQPANAPTPSRNLMAEIDKTRDGGDDDYGLPSTKPAAPKKTDSTGKLISCNSIWYVTKPTACTTQHTDSRIRNQLQSNPDFQDGKFDLDNLCSELRSKARCSESGVMVDQEHVNKALKKLSSKPDGKDALPPAGMPTLMFEQESWDNVLRKLGQNPQ